MDGGLCFKRRFRELAKSAVGIERIAVLRADVDDLGRAFVSGLHDKFGENILPFQEQQHCQGNYPCSLSII